MCMWLLLQSWKNRSNVVLKQLLFQLSRRPFIATNSSIKLLIQCIICESHPQSKQNCLFCIILMRWFSWAPCAWTLYFSSIIHQNILVALLLSDRLDEARSFINQGYSQRECIGEGYVPWTMSTGQAHKKWQRIDDVNSSVRLSHLQKVPD